MKQKQKYVNKVLNFLLNLVLLTLILLFIWLHLVGNGDQNSIQLRTVLTGSMSDSFPQGSLIVTRKILASEVEKGDIITFGVAGDIVTHRVLEIEKNGDNYQFVTKGDNNTTVDAAKVVGSQLKGRIVFSFPFIGEFLLIIQSNAGKVSLLLTVINLLLLEYFISLLCEVEVGEEDILEGV
ncbi:signal peptidase I [Enterococcus sp. AZ109]|uniref:signal peptidase I n=1 Tax=Enterococcus sp. AZ109 TaxID=2774634 RepID=UPI003F288CF4